MCINELNIHITITLKKHSFLQKSQVYPCLSFICRFSKKAKLFAKSKAFQAFCPKLDTIAKPAKKAKLFLKKLSFFTG